MPNLYLRFPGGLSRALTLSYDDGVRQDIRLIEIMNKHGLKGTFNLNSGFFALNDGSHLTEKEALDLYTDCGQEIACHCHEHADLPANPPAAVAWQVLKDRERLEALFARIVKGMAYPYGTFSPQVEDILRSCGIVFSRTTRSTHRFAIPENWLELDPTCHHADPMLMDLAKDFAENEGRRDARLFYLWGHSYEFDRPEQGWGIIEQFAGYISGRENIWYATNMEVYSYVQAYRSLICSADGRRIFNPSLQNVYVSIGGGKDVLCIPSGQEITL